MHYSADISHRQDGHFLGLSEGIYPISGAVTAVTEAGLHFVGGKCDSYWRGDGVNCQPGTLRLCLNGWMGMELIPQEVAE